MFRKAIRSSVFTSIGIAHVVGILHLQYSPYMAPKKQDLTMLNKQERNIVIVGAGIIGLTTAYYLSRNPLNKITVIERNKKPYQETSL
jgi:pyruvate/2-oxoglutarate dehydrogenase complex dihydrolipoamide dehydrogenase (E3) component